MSVRTADEMSAGSPVKLTHCSIGSGDNPTAQVTVENR
jgi:hypothetical protein